MVLLAHRNQRIDLSRIGAALFNPMQTVGLRAIRQTNAFGTAGKQLAEMVCLSPKVALQWPSVGEDDATLLGAIVE
ncbi:hypothetical protein [Brevibacterium metallidurans]|uniref:hypothetical protein n=1 Tax=Brevibacterium metallidurans TaxID=1482676 RepID=UPI0030DBBBC9